MRTIELKTDGQKLIAAELLSVNATVGTIECQFELDAFWDEYPARVANFMNLSSREVISQPIMNGRCEVPWEVLTRPGLIEVAIKASNDEKVERSNPLAFLRLAETIVDGENSVDPTPDQFAQFIIHVKEWCNEQGFSTHEELRELLPIEVVKYFDENYDKFEGPKGDDGISATVEISKVDRVTTLTFTDVEGTKTAEIVDGYTPVKDIDYRDGIDGRSGVYLGTEEPTDEQINVWIDTSGEQDSFEVIEEKVNKLESRLSEFGETWLLEKDYDFTVLKGVGISRDVLNVRPATNCQIIQPFVLKPNETVKIKSEVPSSNDVYFGNIAETLTLAQLRNTSKVASILATMDANGDASYTNTSNAFMYIAVSVSQKNSYIKIFSDLRALIDEKIDVKVGEIENGTY